MAPAIRIAIVAGELSGDLLAAGLIREIRQRHPTAEFEGVTGPNMRAAGCETVFGYEELAVMGLFEVIRHLPRLLRRRRELLDRWRKTPPTAFIGVDAPDFNLGLARRLRSRGTVCIQYVCPSVWAWRQSRVKTIRRAVDLVLCLLPFEADFLHKHRVAATFVGHPLATELRRSADPILARSRLGEADGPIIALLPGSRRGEVERLGEIFVETAVDLKRQRPDVRFVAAMANAATASIIEQQAHRHGLTINIVVDKTRDALTAADAVLVASGTATLEAALCQRPMVVAYNLSPMTYWLLKRLKIIKISTYSLPNLLIGRDVVAEFIQEGATAENLAPALLEILLPGESREAQLAEFAKLRDKLSGDANALAADAVLSLPQLR